MKRNVCAAIRNSPRQRLIQLQNDLEENLKEENDLKRKLKACQEKIESNKTDIDRVTREKRERSHRQIEKGEDESNKTDIDRVTREKRERSHRQIEKGEEESSSEQEDKRRRRTPSEDDSLSSEDPEQTCPPESDFHTSDEEGSYHS